MLNEEFTDLSTMKYGIYVDEWMKECSFHLQKSTFEIHKTYLENVIKPLISNTVHLIFRIVSAPLKKAQVVKLIKENSTIGITSPKIRKTSEINVWTLEEVNHFINKGKNAYSPTRFYIACVIALLMGMRQGEVMGLRWSDIDFENRVIYIRQTLTQTGEIKVGAKNNYTFSDKTNLRVRATS